MEEQVQVFVLSAYAHNYTYRTMQFTVHNTQELSRYVDISHFYISRFADGGFRGRMTRLLAQMLRRL